MTKNNLLSEKLNYTGISQTPTHLHLCSYNPEGVHDCNGKDIDEMIPHLQPNSINWIQIHGLQNTETVQKICQHFGIDFLVTQDILNADHLTKIEEHENYNVIILKQLTAEKDNNYLSQQLCIIQGELPAHVRRKRNRNAERNPHGFGEKCAQDPQPTDRLSAQRDLEQRHDQLHVHHF